MPSESLRRASHVSGLSLRPTATSAFFPLALSVRPLSHLLSLFNKLMIAGEIPLDLGTMAMVMWLRATRRVQPRLVAARAAVSTAAVAVMSIALDDDLAAALVETGRAPRGGDKGEDATQTALLADPSPALSVALVLVFADGAGLLHLADALPPGGFAPK